MDITVSNVVQCECPSEHILTYASHLHSVLGIACSSIAVARSQERYGEIALLHHQHPNHLFVTIDDEVTSIFNWILVLADQLLFI